MEYFRQLDRNGQTYDHSRDWDEKYFLDRSILYLNDVRSKSSIDKLLSVLDESLQQPLGGVASDVRFQAATTLAHAADDAQRESNSELLEYIRAKSPELTGIAASVEASGEPGTEFTLENLKDTLRSIQPRYEDLRSGDFHEKMLLRIETLSKNNPILTQMAEKIQRDGYTLRILDPNDETIPLGIRRIATGTPPIGALTVNGRKEVYFELNALENLAGDSGRTLEQVLAGALGNEATHVLSGATFAPLTAVEREAALALIRIAEPGKYTDAEQKMQSIIIEELASELIGQAVEARLSDANFAVGPESLGRQENGFATARVPYGAIAFERLFSQSLGELEAGDMAKIGERIVSFLNSKELREAVLDRLKQHNLFDENK
jgi:hypothetical protein